MTWGDNDETLSGVISGPGDLDENGAGTLALTGDDTHTELRFGQGGGVFMAASKEKF